jgi:hypothetical protein
MSYNQQRSIKNDNYHSKTATKQMFRFGKRDIPIPILGKLNNNLLCQQRQKKEDHILVLEEWLKENPGLYQMTHKLVNLLQSSGNMVIDDSESGIVTTPVWPHYRSSNIISSNKNNNEIGGIHKISRLMLTRPINFHYADRKYSVTTHDTVCPDITNRNSYDGGGWWTAFSYVTNKGDEINYTKKNIIYQSRGDSKLHRADAGVCEPDADTLTALCQHKQVMCDSAMNNTAMHHVVVTIPELIQVLNDVPCPDFESIANLKKWIDENNNFRTYLNGIVNSDKQELKTPDDKPVTDNTLIAVIQHQTCVAYGQTVHWLNENNYWCSFICENKEKTPNYYIDGKMISIKHFGLVSSDIPKEFPASNKQFIYQREVDYKEYIANHYKADGNHVDERYYCVILTINELADIMKKHDDDVKQMNALFWDDD